jgi:NADP-dependent 3-hydroxy acid dehydrogenase YdfG
MQPDDAAKPLTGRRVLVTGGSSGLGAAAAKACREAGANVACVGRDRDRLEALAQSLGIVALVADVSDADAIEAAVAEADERLGGIDTLIHSAGLMNHSPLLAGRFDGWARMVEVNIMGVMYTMQAATQYLIRNEASDIVIVSSIGGNKPVTVADFALYAGTKASLNRMAEGFRLELGPYGVRIATFNPGLIDTPGFGPGIQDAELRSQAETSKKTIAMSPDSVASQLLAVIAAPSDVQISDITVVPAPQRVRTT